MRTPMSTVPPIALTPNDLALQVGELADAAVGANDGRVVVVAVEAERQQLVDDGDRHARLVERVGHRERRGEAAVELAGDQRRHRVAAAGEPHPFDLVGLAEVLQDLGLLLHEEVRADRDVGADADLDLLLRDGGIARENGGANTHECEQVLRLHRFFPLSWSVPRPPAQRALDDDLRIDDAAVLDDPAAEHHGGDAHRHVAVSARGAASSTTRLSKTSRLSWPGVPLALSLPGRVYGSGDDKSCRPRGYPHMAVGLVVRSLPRRTHRPSCLHRRYK